MAVHSIQQIAKPILISLSPDDYPTIIIDPRHREYAWSVPLTQFPDFPDEVQFGTYPLTEDAPGLGGEVRGVDALFWMIGVSSFAGAPATWLRWGDKFKLKWWPDLDIIPHTPEQAKLVKYLARGLMTAEKLASGAGAGVAEAQNVINALSLMGALRHVPGKSTAPTTPPITPEMDARIPDRGKHARRGG